MNLVDRLVQSVRHPKEDFKAWRRGEHRVAPGMRGRVYARQNEPTDAVKRSGHGAKLKIGAVVTRADGSIERYEIKNGRPVRIDQSWFTRLLHKLKRI